MKKGLVFATSTFLVFLFTLIFSSSAFAATILDQHEEYQVYETKINERVGSTYTTTTQIGQQVILRETFVQGTALMERTTTEKTFKQETKQDVFGIYQIRKETYLVQTIRQDNGSIYTTRNLQRVEMLGQNERYERTNILNSYTYPTREVTVRQIGTV